MNMPCQKLKILLKNYWSETDKISIRNLLKASFCSLICIGITWVYVHKFMKKVQQWISFNKCIYLTTNIICYSIKKMYLKSISTITQYSYKDTEALHKMLKVISFEQKLKMAPFINTTNSLFLSCTLIWYDFFRAKRLYTYVLISGMGWDSHL